MHPSAGAHASYCEQWLTWALEHAPSVGAGTGAVSVGCGGRSWQPLILLMATGSRQDVNVCRMTVQCTSATAIVKVSIIFDASDLWNLYVKCGFKFS